MICANCTRDVAEAAAVKINGQPYHVECFSQGLKQALAPLRKGLEGLEMDMGQIPADVAYRLGQQSMGTLLAARRKAKREKP